MDELQFYIIYVILNIITSGSFYTNFKLGRLCTSKFEKRFSYQTNEPNSTLKQVYCKCMYCIFQERKVPAEERLWRERQQNIWCVPSSFLDSSQTAWVRAPLKPGSVCVIFHLHNKTCGFIYKIHSFTVTFNWWCKSEHVSEHNLRMSAHFMNVA